MALPRQVKQQMAEVEAIEKRLQEGEPVAPDEPTPAAPVEAPPAEPAPAAVIPPEPAVPPPATEPVQQAELELWKQRYSTLQGMYDADVHRVHAQNKDLTKELSDLKAQIEALKKAPVPAEKSVGSVTDKDEEQFGKELIDLQRRIAAETVTPLTSELNALKAENARLLEQLGKTGTDVASVSFEQKLRYAVPDFDAVNADPKWVAWLNEVDPILRAPRRTVAQAAFEAGDALAVKEYVELWKKSLPTANSARASSLQSELQSQVTPTRNSPAVPNADVNTKIYTAKEVDRLWARVTQLGRQGKTEEANKLDAELTAAYTSGRVTG